MNSELIRANIKGIMPTSTGCAVFVGTISKTFVIHMDASMGHALIINLQHMEKERPLTHDLINTIFMGLGVTLENIIINDMENGTFFARIILKMENELGTKLIEVDSRPSDAFVLAAQAEKEFYVTKEVHDRVDDISDIFRKILEQNNLPEQGKGENDFNDDENGDEDHNGLSFK